MTPEIQPFMAAVKDDFGVFLTQAFHELYPDKEFMENWHIDAIVNVLEETLAWIGRVQESPVPIAPKTISADR